MVHLFERDCSLQRRRQKLTEERHHQWWICITRPNGSGGSERGQRLDIKGQERSSFWSERMARSILEMNTRLQVEHPVSEMICGIDLVTWQLRIAMGEVLPGSKTISNSKATRLRPEFVLKTQRPTIFLVLVKFSTGLLRFSRCSYRCRDCLS